jgi:hypothetical protein
MSSDYRKLLPTPCFECVVDIIAWKEFAADGTWQQGWINIGTHSNHVAIWRHSIHQRIVRAWAALRNVDAEGYLDFYNRADVEEFIVSVREAEEACFPPE